MKRTILGVSTAVVTAAVLATASAALAGSSDPQPAGQADAEAAAVAQARANVSEQGRTLAFGAGQELKVKDVILDTDGASHVRFARTHDGMPVVGGEFVVHQKADGSFRSASGSFNAVSDVRGNAFAASAAEVAPQAAANTATQTVDFRPSKAKPERVVDATGDSPKLAWRVHVKGVAKQGGPAGEYVYVDAGTGKVMRSVPTIWNERPNTLATGTGHSLYVGDVEIDTTEQNGQFSLIDPERGNGATYDAQNADNPQDNEFLDDDNEWGDGTNDDPATAGVDAHYGVAETWDYFLKVHKREGIANDGQGATSYVHVSQNWFNAAWDDACFCMLYGDGDGTTAGPLVALDVAGHEMSHGVTSRTANLEYAGESGGLNEATSDIFGAMVEFHSNNVSGQTEDPGDYVIGEEIFLDFDPANNYIRRMDQPSMDGVSYDCYTPDIGNDDVHYSSGVANHFFYLLSEGSGQKTLKGVDYNSPTCDDSDVEGIGRVKARKIWYRALTVYMTETTNYAEARQATVDAATDKFGADSPEVQAVEATWTAVDVTG